MGNRRHRVAQGESIVSIAQQYGLLPDTIWDHADNAELKELRKDPNILYPDDELVIPDITQKQVSLATDQVHSFVIKSTRVVVRVQMYDEDDPVANTAYVLEVGNETLNGTTDGDGILEESIPANAREGVLTLEGDDPISLSFGSLDPLDCPSGAQARLRNLGFDCGPADGDVGERTTAAILDYQASRGLDETGIFDDETIQKIQDEHGS